MPAATAAAAAAAAAVASVAAVVASVGIAAAAAAAASLGKLRNGVVASAHHGAALTTLRLRPVHQPAYTSTVPCARPRQFLLLLNSGQAGLFTKQRAPFDEELRKPSVFSLGASSHSYLGLVGAHAVGSDTRGNSLRSRTSKPPFFQT